MRAAGRARSLGPGSDRRSLACLQSRARRGQRLRSPGLTLQGLVNNFLIPAQGAAAAGRSSRPQLCSQGAARLQCCPDRAVPSRAPSRGSQPARLQCPTLVRMPRRPQQPFLPGPQGRLGGFPAEGPGSLAFRECRHRGVMLRPPPSARVPSIRARWTWLSPDAHEGA